MRLGASVALALVAGILHDAAFPDRGWWWVAVPTAALAIWAFHGRGFWGGVLVGLAFGAGFYFPHIVWATEFLGPVPWAALAGAMSLYWAVSGGLIALAIRWVPRAWPVPAGRVLMVPAVVAGIWIAREGIASVWPYGGFSWGRIAFSQSDGPFADLFAWLGVAGTGYVLVFLAGFAVALVREMLELPRRELAVAAPRSALALVLAVLTLALVPAWTALVPPDAGSIRVGAVQGATKAGYFDPPERVGDNLRGQAAATEPLYGEDVDVVVWPEGGSDLDPLRNPDAAAIWDDVSRRAGAPLVAGTVTARRDPDAVRGQAADGGDVRYYNTAILWRAGAGQLDFYDKKHPVPFGEYVPDRSFWRQFAPDLIDLIGREYTPGTTDSVVDLGAGDPSSPLAGIGAGIAICFDIVDDQLLTEIVEQGGRIVFAVTNNADFGSSDESVQQLAVARIRAIETARTVVNISTVGTSAIILPDGTIAQQLPTYEPGVLLADVPLSASVTPAVLFGRQLEWLGAFVGLAGLLVAGWGIRAGRGVRRSSAAARRPRP